MRRWGNPKSHKSFGGRRLILAFLFQFTKVTLGTTTKILDNIQGQAPTAVQKAGMVPLAEGVEETLSDDEIEAGSSEEEAVDEARTSVPNQLNVPSEEKVGTFDLF